MRVEYWSIGILEHWKYILVTLVAGTCLAGEPVITCEPRELRGVPGEPLQLEVTVETDRASPINLMIPHIDILHLRTVEKIPIQRTEEGRYIQKRILLWQGLESGTTTLTNLTIRFQPLEVGSSDSQQIFQGLKKPNANFPTIGKNQQAATQLLPTIGIVIDEVKLAEPPKKPKETE